MPSSKIFWVETVSGGGHQILWTMGGLKDKKVLGRAIQNPQPANTPARHQWQHSGNASRS